MMEHDHKERRHHAPSTLQSVFYKKGVQKSVDNPSGVVATGIHRVTVPLIIG